MSQIKGNFIKWMRSDAPFVDVFGSGNHIKLVVIGGGFLLVVSSVAGSGRFRSIGLHRFLRSGKYETSDHGNDSDEHIAPGNQVH